MNDLESALRAMRTGGMDGSNGNAYVRPFVTAVKRALEECVSHLRHRGYQFQFEPVRPLEANDKALVDSYRDQLPPLLIEIWHIIGSIDLRGSGIQGAPSTHRGQRLSSNVVYADPLLIEGPELALWDALAGTTGHQSLRFVDLCPDACVKAGFGGGDATHIVLPTSEIDPTVVSVEWHEPMTLGGLLVESLRWWGLPGLRKESEAVVAALIGSPRSD